MNRKQRRAKEATASKISSADDIPLARPPETNERQAKTLYELAAERQAELAAKTGKSTKSNTSSIPITPENIVNVAIGPNGEIKPLDGAILPGQQPPDENETPWLDTLLFAISLSAVHFTFEALVVHQYADELNWVHVFWHTMLKAFPILTLTQRIPFWTK